MNYIVYDLTTGEIKRTGQCPEDMFELQAREGEGVLEGKANDVEEKVVNGEVVPR